MKCSPTAPARTSAGPAAPDPAMVGDRDRRRPLRRHPGEHQRRREKGEALEPARPRLGRRRRRLPGTIRAVGTGVEATLADRTVASANVAPTTPAARRVKHESIGRRVEFPVAAGQTYTADEFVGSPTSPKDRAPPRPLAKPRPGRRPRLPALCWRRTPPPGEALGGRSKVRATRPSPPTSTRASLPLVVHQRRDRLEHLRPPASPQRLQRPHLWDAETWMFPSLLAQHPAWRKA